MIYGYKASNGRSRKLDIRDGCQRLTLDFRAETRAEEEFLAALRTHMNVCARSGRTLFDAMAAAQVTAERLDISVSIDGKTIIGTTEEPSNGG